MLRKVYAYMGKMEANVILRAGLTPIRVVFKNGRGERKLSKPASYATSDPAMQAIIEASPLFKNSTIVLKSKREYPSLTKQVQQNISRRRGRPAKAEAEKEKSVDVADEIADGVVEEIVEEIADGIVEHPEVKTKADAMDLLKANGVDIMNLRNPDDILKALKDKGFKCANLEM